MKILIDITVGLAAIILLLAVAVFVKRKSLSTSNLGSSVNNLFGGMAKDYGTILLVCAGVTIFLFGIYFSSLGSPSLSEVVGRCRENWLWVIILSGILLVLVAKSELGGAVKKVLFKSIIGTALFFLIITPLWFWLTGTSARTNPAEQLQSKTRAEVPLASRPFSEWARITLGPGEKSNTIQIPVGKRLKIEGVGFKIHVNYVGRPQCVREIPGPECPDGHVAGVFFTNTDSRVNTLIYALAPL